MNNEPIKVMLTVDNRKITLEGPEDFVKAEVQRLTGPIKMAETHTPSKPIDGTGSALTERSLISEKRPKNQLEIVAVLGFCLTENGQPEFTEADIKKAYIRAGVRPPKVISQALRDAKNKLDFVESGSKRGLYKLSTHGERTVRFDLPRPESE